MAIFLFRQNPVGKNPVKKSGSKIRLKNLPQKICRSKSFEQMFDEQTFDSQGGIDK